MCIHFTSLNERKKRNNRLRRHPERNGSQNAVILLESHIAAEIDEWPGKNRELSGDHFHYPVEILNR